MPGGKHVDSLPLDRVGKPNAPRPSSKAKPTRNRDVNTYRKDIPHRARQKRQKPQPRLKFEEKSRAQTAKIGADRSVQFSSARFGATNN